MKSGQDDIKTSYTTNFLIAVVIVAILLFLISIIISVVSIKTAFNEIDNLQINTSTAQTIRVPSVALNKINDKLSNTLKSTSKTLNKTEVDDYLKREVVYSKGTIWTDIVIYYTIDTEKLIHLYYKDVEAYYRIKDTLKEMGFISEDIELLKDTTTE